MLYLYWFVNLEDYAYQSIVWAICNLFYEIFGSIHFKFSRQRPLLSICFVSALTVGGKNGSRTISFLPTVLHSGYAHMCFFLLPCRVHQSHRSSSSINCAPEFAFFLLLLSSLYLQGRRLPTLSSFFLLSPSVHMTVCRIG